MDRNTVIGFVLLAILLFAYLFISTKNSQELAAAQERKQDSIALVKRKADSIARLADTNKVKPTIVIDSNTAGFREIGTEALLTVENEVLKITFTNKGGQPKTVELKNYKTIDGKPVILGGTSFDKFSYAVNNNVSKRSAAISEVFFSPGTVAKNADNSQTVSFTTTGDAGESVVHSFVVRPNDYLIDWNVQLNGSNLLTSGAFNLTWQAQPQQKEGDVSYERTQTNICFYEDGDFDYIMSKSEKKFEKQVEWVSVAQQFFNVTLASKTPFSSGDIKFVRETNDTAKKIADITTTLQAKLPIGASHNIPLQLYFGPNDYKILNKQPLKDMDEIVNLGRDMYAFVRPINKYIVMPVFNFFKGFVGSFGIVILLLTVVIRLITSPLMYPGYKTSAQMKVLRPDLAKLKEKFPDQQQYAMEQMKFMREAGVNQFAGCLPSLLQIPIFFALYSFFNSNIALRGQEFLWAENLASYDVILQFPFNIWGLGNHLSLFTLTAAGTSFLISLYNANMTPDQSNPALKYMPYIFPFILLFIFNRLPSALTWYYTVSNIITLILQFVIQKYIIDHDKIVAKIEMNRKKPKTKSKWQERLEQAQETQKKLQEMKNKSAKK